MVQLKKLFVKRKNKFIQSYEKVSFNFFLHSQIKTERQQIIKNAENALLNCEAIENEQAYLESSDPIVQQGFALRNKVLINFKNKYKEDVRRGVFQERIMVHVPSPESSPAGFSIFSNLVETLNFLSVPTISLGWHSDTAKTILDFKPTILLTSDHSSYLERIDWNLISEYRKYQPLKIGLTASLEEYGNTPLHYRLKWANEHCVDFFYSFRDEDYVHSRKEYQPYFKEKYSVLFLPFSANVLHYYPVPGFERDLNFALMASRKKEHIQFLKRIARYYSGFIDGPGWNHITDFQFNRDRDRFIYARAKVGINIHLPEQIEWACELNERTYQLAACGVPQLVDRPKLLERMFTPGSFFIADSPSDFFRLFQELIANPKIGQGAALDAQQQVFSRHTSFHRASAFVEQLFRSISKKEMR
jgi:hypothetical protein